MYLKTEEVKLYYEVRGEGKPLLLIHGVVVDAAMYEEAAKLLSRFYQVITYDRRGNSRSKEVYRQEYDVNAQVRDAVKLLEYLQIEKVFVVGASAGAVVAMELYKQNPHKVERVLLYEAPMVPLLKDETENAWIAGIEDKVSKRKLNGAMFEFMMSLGETDERRMAKPEEVEAREMNNFYHFLQNEFSVFMHYEPEIEYFKGAADKFIVAVGDKSGMTKYVRGALILQEMMGCELLHFPGCHNLPCDLPVDFVTCLMGVLARSKW